MSGFEFNKDMALKLVFQRADDPEPIGVLDFSGPEMTFSGRADESAKAFFDAVIKNQVGWNERQLDVRREVERELAAAKAELVSKADELAAAIKQRDEARDTAAAIHKRNWYEAKTEYGTALGKVRAELAAAKAELAAAKKRIEELEAPIRNPLSRALELEEALRHMKQEGGGA